MDRKIGSILGSLPKKSEARNHPCWTQSKGDPVLDGSQINSQTLKDIYDAFAIGDSDAVARHVTHDLIIHVPGRSWNAGEYWGLAGLKEFMGNIALQSGGTLKMQVPVVSITGDHAFTREVVALKSQTIPEREFILGISNHFRFRDGRLSELWVIPEDQRAYDAYFTQTRPGVVASVVRQTIDYGSSPSHLLDVSEATSSENAQLLAGMYRNFLLGDMDAMRRVISEDVIVNITGQSAMSGQYLGWAGYMKFRDKLVGMSGSKYRLDVEALAAGKRDLWAREYIRMNRRWDPTVHAVSVVMHFEFDSGKIIRMDDFPVDPYLWEQFYLPPDPGTPSKRDMVFDETMNSNI